MAQRKVKRYRPSWDKQKMVWDPFGLWVRYVAPDTAPSSSASKGRTKLPPCVVCCGEAPWIDNKSYGYNYCPKCGRKLRE